MRNVKVWVLSLLLIGAVSCSKDDEPANRAPVVEAKTITVDETATGQIGTVTASDPDGDEITLGISTNFEGLYEITDAGALSLAAGKSLDSKTSHTITVTAFDGKLSGDGKITININNVNKAPEITADQVFEVAENVMGPLKINPGVVATDADGDDLSYELTDNADGLFAISPEGGVLSLAEGKTLDFEKTESYVVIVSVTDGTDTTTAELTINVIDDTSLSDDPNSFVTTWTTDGQGVEIQLNSEIEDENLEGLTFDYMIDWGDGSEVEELTTAKPIHVYEEPGTYTVAIAGQFPAFRVLGYEDYFTSMEQWGNSQWQNLASAFLFCDGMVYNAQDDPDLSLVEDLSGMFGSVQPMAITFSGSISGWSVENVKNMAGMFINNTTFNQDISDWGVSNVESMFGMFDRATAFDQNLGSWNIGSIESMQNMFDDSGMSPENFSRTLTGWANPPEGQTIPSGVGLGAQNMRTCIGGELDPIEAMNTLEDDNNWTITGLGLPANCDE